MKLAPFFKSVFLVAACQLKDAKSNNVNESSLRRNSATLEKVGEDQRELVEDERLLDEHLPGVLYSHEKPKLSRPLPLCHGDCNGDLDCEGDLICLKRRRDEPVPDECSGSGEAVDGVDYCIDPTWVTAPPPGILHKFANSRRNRPLGRCFADCNDDSHCEGDLICMKRSKDEPVPGCEGIPVTKADYCIDPPPTPEETTTLPITASPTVAPGKPAATAPCPCCQKIMSTKMKPPLKPMLLTRFEALARARSQKRKAALVRQLKSLYMAAKKDNQLTLYQDRMLSRCIRNAKNNI